MNQIKKYSLGCVVGVSLLQACGSPLPLQRGVFVDSPVQGLQYRTETQQGLTDAEGGFVFLPGETVVFSVGDLEFAQVPAQWVITPMELASSDDIESLEVVNILRLLQTIDEDSDPTNGITIPESAHEMVLAPTFNFTGTVDIDAFIGTVIKQTYGVERDIVDADTAVGHLVNTLSEQASDPATAAWDLDLLYLVEGDAAFDGSYLSIGDANFELNLNNELQSGAVKENTGVYQLAGVDQLQFFTPGLNSEGAKVGCLAGRPYAVDECASNGQLFHVFDDETTAKVHSGITTDEVTQEQAAVEPEFEAAQPGEENTPDTGTLDPDLLTPEDLFPACSAALVDDDADQYGWENGETCYFVPASGATPTTPEPAATPEPVVTPQPAAVDTGGGTQAALTLATTSDCPTAALHAPATFSVFAAEPSGCTWTPFTGQAWSWGSNSNYDSATNSITDVVGGAHQGTFEHSCIDLASGREIIVTATCDVVVDSAPGIDAITDLFFLTGQSNAASLETAYDATLDAVDHRVFAYTDTGWQLADLHQFWEQDIPGNYSIQYPERSPFNNIAFQVAKSIAAKSDRVVGIVMLTAPGEGISHWDYNSDFYIKVRDKALAALNSLPNKSSFDGMLWLQGETDWLLQGSADPGATGFSDTNSDFYLNYYPNKLFQLISNLRSESWFGIDGKFICAETKKAELNPHLMALNINGDPLSGCAQASDLGTRGSDPYGSHYSAISLRVLGGRIADVYLDMVP